MNRHTFRWTGFAFGLLFLVTAAYWAVREQDLLSSDQLNFTLSAVLIAAGVLGVVATFVKPRRAATPLPVDTTPENKTIEENHEQATHPQP